MSISPPYLTCHELHASYDSKVLFENLSFAVHPGERWGIIGPNGAGKSTLFKMIKGDLKPDKGSISLRNNTRIAFIDQKISIVEELSVLDVLKNALPFEYDSEAQMKQIEFEIEKHNQLANTNLNLVYDPQWQEILSELNERLSNVPGTPTENIILSALKLGQLEDFSRNQFKNLSGGQQKKVQIICALLKNPQLIFLDEPTNHLDVQTVEWLEEFLLKIVENGFSLLGLKTPGQDLEAVSFVIISHDRALLDTLVNKILEIEDGEARQFEGNYEAYTEKKLDIMAINEKECAKMANTMRRELEWLRSGTKARTTKQTARIARAHSLDKNLQNKQRKLNTNKNTELGFQPKISSFARDKDDNIVAKHLNLGDQELIAIKNASISHPGKSNFFLFKNLNLVLKPKSRIAILGHNGSGKSTLLNLIYNKTSPIQGEIKYHELAKPSYFDQKRYQLSLDDTVREVISHKGDQVFFDGKYIHIMSYLEKFLFSKYDANRKIIDLSGGEQARLLLAKLMLEQGNVLILDEPTNDLDIPTLQVLEKNLLEFKGAVIFTSHDRYFMQRVSTSVIAYTGSNQEQSFWQIYADLNQALEQVNAQQSLEKGNKDKIPNKKEESSSDIQQNNKKKLSFKHQKEFEALEQRISQLETIINKHTEDLNRIYSENLSYEKTKEISDKIEYFQKELESCYEKWGEFI